jgi:hypothetical protein
MINNIKNSIIQAERFVSATITSHIFDKNSYACVDVL